MKNSKSQGQDLAKASDTAAPRLCKPAMSCVVLSAASCGSFWPVLQPSGAGHTADSGLRSDRRTLGVCWDVSATF